MEWVQRRIQLPAMRKGLHPITRHICEALPEMAAFEVGILHVFIQHTSASLTINEAADPDVPTDLENLFDRLAPETFPYQHTIEGPDDMPAHGKASLFGSSVTVPVCDGRPALGTWQGIFLCEHRRRASGRHVVLTLWGERRK